MRVFFTTPYAGKIKYQAFIDEVLSVLSKSKVALITPEESHQYQEAIEQFSVNGLQTNQAHYAYIIHGIAEADVVIMEASHEDFRIGHEATLALLYNKPTLILSRHINYEEFISHELLSGRQYRSKRELRTLVQDFLDKAEASLNQASETAQAIGATADALHMAMLATSRRNALHDEGEFGEWARLAETNPDKAYDIIQKTLGHLSIGEAWSVFAPSYNEDTPDFIFSGVANFIHTIFRKRGITTDDAIGDAVSGTGAMARNLVSRGYRSIYSFDKSREMLAEAFRLCAHLPSIKLFEADVSTVRFPALLKAIVWVDYRSNFALTAETLTEWVNNLLANLLPGGYLLFDIRTITGWRVSFYRQKVTTFASDNFQRIWMNLPDYEHNLIDFDVFIRRRNPNGLWGAWKREQMRERMWSLAEVTDVVASLPHCHVEAIYDDNFSPIRAGQEPSLAYFLLRKMDER